MSNEFNDSSVVCNPKKDGWYMVKANDIVNSWQEELFFKDNKWYMLDGNLFPAIIDDWREL